MQITYEDLANSSVHKIREIARNVGVKSPTVLSKQKLIEQILKINNNEIEPTFNKSKVGRPPKSLTILSKKGEAYDFSKKSTGIHSLNYTPSYFVSEKEGANTKTFSGCLYIGSSYGVLLTTKNQTVIVTLPMLNHNKLRAGDRLTVMANPDTASKGVYVAFKLVSPTTKTDRPEFDDLATMSSSEVVKITSNVLPFLDYKLGEKYFIETYDSKTIKIATDEIFKNSPSNLKKFYMNFDANRSEEKLSNVTEYKILFNDLEEDKLLKVDVLLECVKRELEKGEQCLFVFSGFWKYMRDINLYFSNHAGDKVLLKTITKIRDIVALARATENGGSITLFVIDTLDMPSAYQEVMQYDVIANMDNKYTIKEL